MQNNHFLTIQNVKNSLIEFTSFYESNIEVIIQVTKEEIKILNIRQMLDKLVFNKSAKLDKLISHIQKNLQSCYFLTLNISSDGNIYIIGQTECAFYFKTNQIDFNEDNDDLADEEILAKLQEDKYIG